MNNKKSLNRKVDFANKKRRDRIPGVLFFAAAAFDSKI
jgi:hypothetical protein